MSKTSRQLIPINVAVYACLLAGMVLLASAIAFFLPKYATSISIRAAERAIQIRSATLASDLARRIGSDWIGLQYLAGEIGRFDPGKARAYLDGVVGSGEHVSWAGYANPDGIVAVASGGLLEGADVSKRPWFSGGMRGKYAGNVHEAVLLQNLLGGKAEEPLRFIDLAIAVPDSTGRIAGVLSLLLNFNWIENYLAGAANSLSMDFLLIGADGSVVASSIAALEDPLSLATIRAAMTGTSTTIQENWPDGISYFASVISEITYEDLPNFGWRLVGRIPANAFSTDGSDLFRNVIGLMIAAAAIFAIAAVLFANVFLRPVSRLIDSADAISRGKEVYPDDFATTREAAVLSSSLARIQTRLGAGDSR